MRDAAAAAAPRLRVSASLSECTIGRPTSILNSLAARTQQPPPTMKSVSATALLAGSAAAFAPASTGRSSSVALNAAEKSQALPFLPAPENTKGYVGDVGFDPLRISDYFPMDYLREAELKHGRICMLAWTGWVAVDLGARIYPLPQEWEGLTSASAHDPLVAYGSLGNLLVWIAMAEMTSWIGISAMLQGSGRAPGDFGLGVGLLEGKSEEAVNDMKLKEIKNGRLAMLAFSGVVTQSVLTGGGGFPYTGERVLELGTFIN